PLLAVLGADGGESTEVARIAPIAAERGRPSIGDGNETRVDSLAQRRHHRRQRLGEVLVLADTESIALHVDPASESAVVTVEGDQLSALLGREQRGRRAPSPLVERLSDRVPVEAAEPFLD